MIDLTRLIDALREMLGNLYDPMATVPEPLAEALCVTTDDVMLLRERLQQAIHQITPEPDVPGDTRAWRLYEILRLRYLEHLTQEEVAQRLAITVRHLSREQNAALELLAQRLGAGKVTSGYDEDTHGSGRISAQVEAEVAALRAHPGAATANVLASIEQTQDLVRDWCARRQVVVRMSKVEADLAVAVHPSLLHQVLIAAMSYAVRGLDSGEIELSAYEMPGEVIIQAQTSPALTEQPPEDWVARELIETQDGMLVFDTTEVGSCLQIRLPSARSVKVLVLDDNTDLVHFYRLCMSSTIYRMVSLAEGRRVFEVIAREQPRAIVLDLMLPDVDGWELLSQLHEHPSSRGLPVIVCSVVHEEELALALGATACVNKPVRRQELLAALDGALSQAASGASPEPGSSATTS